MMCFEGVGEPWHGGADTVANFLPVSTGGRSYYLRIRRRTIGRNRRQAEAELGEKWAVFFERIMSGGKDFLHPDPRFSFHSLV